MGPYRQIGQVAKELGINAKTIRYYEDIALIPPATRAESGYRLYGQDDIDRIAFIVRARELDLSLDDIREILGLRERGEAPCHHVVDVVEKQLAAVSEKIADLEQLRNDLEAVQRKAEAIPSEQITNKYCVCHLIENQALQERNP